MSEPERSEIIRIYQERRMYEERRRAAEAEMRAREMAELRARAPHLIHLHLSGGVFIYRGSRYHYHAHNLRLHQGEQRQIELVSMSGNPLQRITLWVGYKDGNVVLGDGRRTLRSFAYHDSWREGEHHREVKLRGAVRMEGVDIVIGSKPYRAERQQEQNRDNGKKGSGLMKPSWADTAAKKKAQLELARKKQQQQQEKAVQDRLREEQQRKWLEQQRSKHNQQKQKQVEREQRRTEQQSKRLEQQQSKQNQQKRKPVEQKQAEQKQAEQKQAEQKQAEQEPQGLEQPRGRSEQQRGVQDQRKQENGVKEHTSQDKE